MRFEIDLAIDRSFNASVNSLRGTRLIFAPPPANALVRLVQGRMYFVVIPLIEPSPEKCIQLLQGLQTRMLSLFVEAPLYGEVVAFYFSLG